MMETFITIFLVFFIIMYCVSVLLPREFFKDFLDPNIFQPEKDIQSILRSLSREEINQKVNFYNDSDRYLRKWLDLRENYSINEDEYQEKKEQGQYVNNALANISFVMKIIFYAKASNLYNYDDGKDTSTYEYETGKKEVIELNIEQPQNKLRGWLELENSNGITKEEYQKLKEEFLKEEGVNKNCIITKEIELWSDLRYSNGITEEEYQKLKVYLLKFMNI